MFRSLRTLFAHRTPRTRSSRFARLGVTALEGRDVPAAGVTFLGSIMVVEGCDGVENRISVSPHYSGVGLGVSIYSSISGGVGWGGTYERYTNPVTEILLIGKDKADTLTNGTNLPATLYGQGGSDTLIGGSAADKLLGAGESDSLSGGGGNDILQGGTGNDTLAGGAGLDELRGGDGKDTLYGGTENDRLFGEGGADTLYGEAGNDMLFGGINEYFHDVAGGAGRYYDVADGLSGGSGADRLLLGESDTVLATGSTDAMIRFQNGAAGTYKGTVHRAGWWTNEEVERFDGAFARLQDRTGNTTLLRRANGDQMTFVRLGGNNGAAGAWNSRSDHKIYCPDNGIVGTGDGVQGMVIHEIGHNWDEENPRWRDFLRVSGWTQTDPRDPVDFTRIDKYGETWWYRTGTEFVSGYAMTHPRDDFADSFAAVFLGNTAAIPRKAGIINAWLDAIAG